MKGKLKLIITLTLIILALVGITILKNKKANEAKVPKNDPYLAGNTSGNLYNKGLFVESNGKVYFANPYDSYSIYVMNADQTDCKKLVNATASYLNVLGDYIYYYTSTTGEQSGLGYVRNGRGLFRSSLSGKKTFSLTKTESDGMIAVGNNVYFTSFEEGEKKDTASVTVHKTTTANKGNDIIIDEHIKLGGYSNGELYYGGIVADHHLYAYNLESGTSRKVSDINVYLPIVEGSNVYFLDLDDEYKLKCYSMANDSVTTIINERVDTYNISGGVIVYQTAEKDNYALKRINIDGTSEMTIQTGVFSNINVTSNYIYFTNFNTDYPVYYVESSGYGSVNTFDNAARATMKSK